jgi:hypothetical protein
MGLRFAKMGLCFMVKFRGVFRFPVDSCPWLTFIGHAKDSPWSVDLFRRECITLNTHRILLAMDQFTRWIIGFGVHAGDVNGIALCGMLNKAISRMGVPRAITPGKSIAEDCSSCR